MRAYQEIGLTPEAFTWIKQNTQMVGIRPCPHCGKSTEERIDSKTYSEVDSFYGDGPRLQEYNLKDGSTIREVVQIEPWSSGPMSFFCLEKPNRERIYQWTNREVNFHEDGLCPDNDEIAGQEVVDKGA